MVFFLLLCSLVTPRHCDVTLLFVNYPRDVTLVFVVSLVTSHSCLSSDRYVGAGGLIALLSELLLGIYCVVLTVLAVISMVKTRGGYVTEITHTNRPLLSST